MTKNDPLCRARACTKGGAPLCRLHYFMLPEGMRAKVRRGDLGEALDLLWNLENKVTILYSCTLRTRYDEETLRS